MKLPVAARKELLEAWAVHGDAIRLRLKDFSAVPKQRYMYELFFCVMTPQSSAAQCALVAEELERRNFLDVEFDPTPLLRGHAGGYVRFHNTKARRLLDLRHRGGEILRLFDQDYTDKELRDVIADSVDGLGMKEASHFLRNVGRGGVTIVDRHIIRNLIRLGILEAWPANISRKTYREIEQRFENLAAMLGIPHEELDLLLWQRETGFILK
jgi:N-glycosylase/DNA lyase